MYRGGGSIAIVGHARSALLVAQDAVAAKQVLGQLTEERFPRLRVVSAGSAYGRYGLSTICERPWNRDLIGFRVARTCAITAILHIPRMGQRGSCESQLRSAGGRVGSSLRRGTWIGAFLRPAAALQCPASLGKI
jgi:hypothetical protein